MRAGVLSLRIRGVLSVGVGVLSLWIGVLALGIWVLSLRIRVPVGIRVAKRKAWCVIHFAEVLNTFSLHMRWVVVFLCWRLRLRLRLSLCLDLDERLQGGGMLLGRRIHPCLPRLKFDCGMGYQRKTD